MQLVKHFLFFLKKKLGRSIEERPKEIESREEFGHWECDLVLGSKTRDDQVLLTLAERESREFLMIPIADKTSKCVMKAMKKLQETYSEHFSEVFKTITTDNGSEFADLANLGKVADTLIYYLSSIIFFTYIVQLQKKDAPEDRHKALIFNLRKVHNFECIQYCPACILISKFFLKRPIAEQ